ncbi:MAG TPA: ATPase, T2SS/T4P/T4SS family, partial [Bacteroidia bacterium]|nr:ATPase, T2SS/T4P/T4SS family [Bacteroidia bacterium]
MKDHIPLAIDLQQQLTTDQAWHYAIVPKLMHNGTLELYIDEANWSARTPSEKNGLEEELEVLLGKRIIFEKIASEIIRKTLSKYYLRNARNSPSGKVQSLSAKQGDDFLPSLISEAKQLGSSDIHIECYEDRSRVRIRIDGLLVERYTISKADYPALINKIKIRANLDIAEKRLPQDGRIFFQAEGMKFDIRVSVLPTLHGEKVVLRLLNNDATNIDIRTLGFTERQMQDYLEGV